MTEDMYFRPPSEANSLLIRVMHGCPYNKCTFCNVFKSVSYRPVPLSEIRAVMDQDAEEFGPEFIDSVDSIYLEGGDPMALPTGDLLYIMDYAKSRFPALKRFTCYATALFTIRKSADDLKALARAGLERVFVGLESGLDELLSATTKGCTSADLQLAGGKLKEAGIEMDVSMMLGIGGLELSKQHALATAELLNAIEPVCVRIRTYLPKESTPLGLDYLEGRFRLMDAHQTLRELRLMVANITGRMQLLSEHWSDFIMFNAYMPEAKEELLKYIDQALALPLSAFRETGLSSGRA